MSLSSIIFCFLYYKCQEIHPNATGSNIDSLKYIKNRKAAINLINKKDSKCFQYTVAVVLNHD